MNRLHALLLCAALLGGCSSSVAGTAPRHTARTVSVGFAAKGHTVRLSVGDSLKVRLGSTYWQFGHVAGPVLTAGRPVMHGAKRPHPYPGSGDGTLTVTYRAVRSGTATVTASRTSCGEAMRCVHGLGTFRLTVVVH